jgi:hypothetical protein
MMDTLGKVVRRHVSIRRCLFWLLVQQKLWLVLGLSGSGLVIHLAFAHILSRRFTRPITRLHEGVRQIGSGHLVHQVVIWKYLRQARRAEEKPPLKLRPVLALRHHLQDGRGWRACLGGLQMIQWD